MPHYIDADILRNEIERLKGQLIRGACAAQIEMRAMCKEEAYDEVLSFISTLESEKPMQKELEEEIDRIVKCEKEFMNFQCRHQLISYIARHFAQWGAEHAREQMMKDAVCYIAQPDITATGNIVIPFIRIGYTALSRYGIKVGDKVRIIILPKESEQ